MRALVAVAALAACSSKPAHDITITTSFVADTTTGTGTSTSPLAPLIDQPIDIEVTIDAPNIYVDDSGDTAGCHSRYFETAVAGRTAFGTDAATVTAQILDMLPDWYVRVQICATASESSVSAVATIDSLNLSFACGTVPLGAQVVAGDGYPELVSVAATGCSATILDVSNNLDIGNQSFAMTVDTGPAQLP